MGELTLADSVIFRPINVDNKYVFGYYHLPARTLGVWQSAGAPASMWVKTVQT